MVEDTEDSLIYYLFTAPSALSYDYQDLNSNLGSWAATTDAECRWSLWLVSACQSIFASFFTFNTAMAQWTTMKSNMMEHV